MLMYNELAQWWPLISSPADYAEEAGIYAGLLCKAGNPAHVLEIGSGGGNNASHMKRHFRMTLADVSEQMLAVSRKLNPDCTHVQGDMREMRLGQLFDAVFVHDAIMYMTTLSDLRRAIETAALHCRPGGSVLLAPDCFRENARFGCEHGGHDGDGRSARYIEWDYDLDPNGTVSAVDYVFLLREGIAPARVVHDHHRFGLFPRQTWLQACRDAGLQPELPSATHSESGELSLILCRKA